MKLVPATGVGSNLLNPHGLSSWSLSLRFLRCAAWHGVRPQTKWRRPVNEVTEACRKMGRLRQKWPFLTEAGCFWGRLRHFGRLRKPLMANAFLSRLIDPVRLVVSPLLTSTADSSGGQSLFLFICKFEEKAVTFRYRLRAFGSLIHCRVYCE